MARPISWPARSRELERANQVADAASWAKSDFLANMSHEIRTPMNGVLGMLEVLEHTKLEDEQKRILARARASGRSLLSIIDDVFDISKIEAGRMTVEYVPTDLAELIESTTKLFLGAAAAKEISLRCFVSPSVRGKVMVGPVRLRQIVSNLISNAVKFTHAGGVTITLRRVRGARVDSPDDICLYVADTDVGISPNAQLRLLMPFTQADESTARRFGGTGLGLSICLRLTELMGGKIKLTSTLGVGTDMTLTLPARDTAARIDSDVGARLAGVRVGLITSDLAERVFIADYLSFWGAEVSIMTPEEAPLSGVIFNVVISRMALAPEVRRAAERGMRVGPPRRFVFFTYADQPLDRLESTGDAIVTTGLSRARVITAVAVAAGLQSPEVEIDMTATGARPTAPPTTREDAITAGRLILFAEDHPVNRDVIMRQLHLLGYAADAVESGVQAVAALGRTDYALLLTDCNMPEMDCFALTRHIRREGGEQKAPRHLPIVALTANAMDGEAERCLEAGMDDYLSKPVEMTKLRVALERWPPPAPLSAAPEPPAPSVPNIPPPKAVEPHMKDIIDPEAL